MLSDRELEELLALSQSEYATPVPWSVYAEPEVGMPPTIMWAKPLGQGFYDQIEPLTSTDKTLAVRARNALPELIVEVLRLRRDLRAEAEKMVDAMYSHQGLGLDQG